MAEEWPGRLLWQDGKPVLDYVTKKGIRRETPLPLERLARTLREPSDRPTPVVMTLNKDGEPDQVRRKGEDWAKVQPVAAAPAAKPPPAVPLPPGLKSAAGPFTPPARSGDFRNPFSFVPAPDRTKLAGHRLGDVAPLAQDRYHAVDRFKNPVWSGRLSLALTAVTPLLLPDADPVEAITDGPETVHKIYRTRRDPLHPQRPYLAPTALKGMLRSAYEAATNSRFGIFDRRWADPLVRRLPAKDGLAFVPARIVDGQIELLLGTSTAVPKLGKKGMELQNGRTYAAAVTLYDARNGQLLPNRLRPSGGQAEFVHGDAVICRIQLVRKERYSFWQVIDMDLPQFRTDLAKRPARRPVAGSEARTVQNEYEDLVSGWFFCTRRNMDGKHDERVFFSTLPESERQRFVLTEDLRRRWAVVIADYQELHKDEISRKIPRPTALKANGGSVWSRHVACGSEEDARRERQLHDGDLLYVRVEDKKITGLSPVAIGREFYPASPRELAAKAQLLPADSLEQLSPAERVFGWVHDEAGGKARTAWRGQLSVGPVDASAACIESLTDQGNPHGLPLAILGQPKPQQALFYAADNAWGEPPKPGGTGGDARQLYAAGKGLRGRKIYPHHADRTDGAYWQRPTDPKATTTADAQGPIHEYRRPDVRGRGAQEGPKIRDDQNRSYRDWVRIGSRFTVDLHITNLSEAELGALVWLLQRPEGQCHRIGNGKPLGFGSVRIEVTGCALSSGAHLAAGRYAGLGPAPAEIAAPEGLERFLEAFRKANEEAYGSAQPYFLKALEAGLAGQADLPRHYPRLGPAPQAELYEWYVKNAGPNNRRLPLPALWDDRGLPFDPTNPSTPRR